jgi:hypothetical protein
MALTPNLFVAARWNWTRLPAGSLNAQAETMCRPVPTGLLWF